MKCDELEKFNCLSNAEISAGIDANYVYDADEVDEAIAELKQNLHDIDNQWNEQCKEIAELKDVIHELQVDLEGAKATAYADSVDAGMSERRLRRALWLARAYRAEARKNYWYARSCHEGDERLWSIDGSAVKYIGCIKRTNFDWLKVWSEVEIKCLKKAEEYK